MVRTRQQASKAKPPSSPGPGEPNDDSSSDNEDIPATTSTARKNGPKKPATLRPSQGPNHMHSQSPLKRKEPYFANKAGATKRQKRAPTTTHNDDDDATATAQSALGIVNAAFRPSEQTTRMVIPIPTTKQLLAQQQTNRSTRSESQQLLRRGRSAGLSTRDGTPMSMDKSPPRGRILPRQVRYHTAEDEEPDDISSNLAEAPTGRSRRTTLEPDPPHRARKQQQQQQRLSAIEESPQVEDRGYPALDRLLEYMGSPTTRPDFYNAPLPIAEEQPDEQGETDQVRQQLEHVYEKDISPGDVFESARQAKETQFHTAPEHPSPDLGSGFDIDQPHSLNETTNENERSPGQAAAQPSSYQGFETQPPPQIEFPNFQASQGSSSGSGGGSGVYFGPGPDGMYRDARGRLPNGLPSMPFLGTQIGLAAPPSGQRQVIKSSPPPLGSQFVDYADQIDHERFFNFSGGDDEGHDGRLARGVSEGSELFVRQHDEELASAPADEEWEVLVRPGEDESLQRQRRDEGEEEVVEIDEQVGGPQEEAEVEAEQVMDMDMEQQQQAEEEQQDEELEPEPVRESSPPPLPSIPAHLRRIIHDIPPRINATSATNERSIRANPQRTNGTFGTNGVHLDDPFQFSDAADNLPRQARNNTSTNTRRRVPAPQISPPTTRGGRSSRTEQRSLTARESSRTVGSVRAASTVAPPPPAAGRSSLATTTAGDAAAQNLVTLPSALVTKMHKLMGGLGWTELNKTWSVDLFQANIFDGPEDDDDDDDVENNPGTDTPAITRLGTSLFKYLVTLKNKFRSAAPTPHFEGWLNAWLAEHEGSVDRVMSEVDKFIKKICKERLAPVGDSTLRAGNDIERRKALTRDLVLCLVPMVVHTLWWTFALGGVDETVQDDLSRAAPRTVQELRPRGEFTPVAVRYLVRVTGWLVRLDKAVMFELGSRPFYRGLDIVNGLSQDRTGEYTDKCKKKRAMLGKFLREWNGELGIVVGKLKSREEKERKRLASLAGQTGVIEARKRAKQRENEEDKRQYEAFARSTQDVRRKMAEEQRKRIVLGQKVKLQERQQYFVDEDEEDEEFVSATEGGEHRDEGDEENPFASPAPPRYTPWTTEDSTFLLSQIRRKEPGQPLATKQDYEDIAEALDKSLGDVMNEAGRLRAATRKMCGRLGLLVERWAVER